MSFVFDPEKFDWKLLKHNVSNEDIDQSSTSVSMAILIWILNIKASIIWVVHVIYFTILETFVQNGSPKSFSVYEKPARSIAFDMYSVWNILCIVATIENNWVHFYDPASKH